MENAQTLDRFLQQVERRAFAMAKMATGHREEALDIVQDVMLKFSQKYARKPQDEWAPLFYRVLQNMIRDWGRRSKVRNRWRVWLGTTSDKPCEQADPVQVLADPAAVDPALGVAQAMTVDAFAVALAQLPARQKQAFLLRVWEGMDVAQTAQAMAVSQGSVKTHYSRAVHSLRKQLQGHWP